ncbi:hypothetical protein SDC9_52983 [bioreactor metagenome]|uniref:AlgX/AlgJ SGNH hydrolase-like domain-containing protein n=1 Tax=bioreactor metagenome TaxID=1076179 RepID=A0A644WT19_9ZZZZ
MEKAKKNLIYIVFLISLLLPLLFSDFKGGGVSESEKRVLAKFPDIELNSLNSVNEFKDSFDIWFIDNIGFRNSAMRIKASIEYWLFNVSSNKSVVVGKDGWLFYTGSSNLEIAAGTYPISQEKLINIKNNQQKVQDKLHEKGINYLIILVPSKVSVYPENLYGNYSIRPTVIDKLSSFLGENTSIPVINLKNELLDAKVSDLLYYKQDTHWNDLGAYVGYCSVIKTLNQMNLLSTSPAGITFTDSTHDGDLLTMLNVDLPQEESPSININNSKAFRVQNGEQFTEMAELTKQADVKSFYIYKNPNVKKYRVLIYGDSFFNSSPITMLLAENVSELYFVPSYEIMEDMINYTKPDLVILEITERFINNLDKVPSPSDISK